MKIGELVPGLSFPKKGFDGAVDGGSSAAKVFADRGNSVVSVKLLICHGLLIIVVRFLIMIEWLRRSKRVMGGLTPSVFGDVMFFIAVFIFLEILTVFFDPYIKRFTGFSDRSVLFIGQSMVFFIAAFLPLIGVPFVDIKNGEALVADDVAWGGVVVAFLFFCMGMAFKNHNE